MCGRFTLRTPAKLVAKAFRVPEVDLQPHFNIAPSQQVAVVRLNKQRDQRELAFLKWGLVPSWADDHAIGYKMTYAAETAATETYAACRATDRFASAERRATW